MILRMFYEEVSTMATCKSVCAVCDHRHQTSPSSHWCNECEEPLCSDCREHHNALKVTRYHITIPISEYQLLPTVVTEIKQNCVFHNEMYQLYCNKHGIPICNKCVKDHGKCGEIFLLGEVVRDIKTSESFIDLEQNLDDLFDDIIQIRKERETNIESIKDQKKKIAVQVCHLKNQVIQHLNKLEEKFIKELDQIEFNCCDLTSSIVSLFQDKAKEINQMKSEIKHTKKYASDLQAFLSMREIQAKTTEYEKHLQSSIEDKNYAKISIKSTIDSKILDFLFVDTIGSITVNKSPSAHVYLKKRKNRQAQMQVMVPKAMKSINNIEHNFKRKINTTGKYVCGCCVTSKGEQIVTDHQNSNEKIIKINTKGKVEYTIPFTKKYNAFDVVCLDDYTVAVSSGYSFTKPGISIIDLHSRKMAKFIDLPSYPYGIAHNGSSLICCVEDKDIHVISCIDYNITTIPNTVLPEFSYVSTHADKIFFTNPNKNTVSCCLYSGTQVWEFKDKSVLDLPKGISVDNNGNVFVNGCSSKNVVVISPDGKQCKEILNRIDGLNTPLGNFFDKDRKQLLVANATQFANVYNISYS
ncbi:uncharacterized protein LOC127705046 isoform X2 [Mytilus californianus]|uniref:uncharacterized protein LOC127705046 isoform X2 n=1 Tax=Mytilus californianus TaxID=6549 RepID=UPI0022478255|nr:uncharacterized protein LOC127705046 isoform X2 [Mytilus californianus]